MGRTGEAAADLNLEEETIAIEEQQDEARESDADECFFESLDRVSSGVSFDLDLPSSGSESDEEDEEVRISFASAMEAPRFSICVADLDECFYDDNEGSGGFDFGIWMAEPVSLTERRRRLLQVMGLTSRKELAPSKSRLNPNAVSPPLPPKSTSLIRSLSVSQSQAAMGIDRTFSWPPSQWIRPDICNKGGVFGDKARSEKGSGVVEAEAEEVGAAACRIRNLDNGKDFVLSEVGKDGTCGRLNDLQTGMQLTMDEFERFLGFSPIVNEFMRRVNLGEGKKKNGGDNGSSTRQGYGAKSSKSESRKTGNWLKNIKLVASSVTGFISEKERCHSISATGKSSLNWNSPDWLKVHQHGKTYKELTGLYMCQEIQAHCGSIWCMKFSLDGRFLASAGEDRIVRVWQVMQSETFLSTSSMRQQELRRSATSQALDLSATSRMEQAAILSLHSSNRTRKKSKKHSLPDYVVLPDTIFSISETPFCSFEGHLDDILDLSWSKSQHLISSSMDKTVRLWDMESRSCLKLFAHNDYVTCIQFNPVDDDYFISGSLDGKVRMWSIPNRQVVDWSDLHEMVTAVSYTPDGQGALVGSHKGTCRFYNISNNKLSQENQIDISNKKKKSNAKKITGFQFAPDNPSQVMVTSAGSRIRVIEGVDIVHKFRGFRNTSSQISASFSSDGKYVICASEDSNVYIWKRGAAHSTSVGAKSKSWATTRSREFFYCKDVSVAIPWPNSGSNCEKPTLSSPSSTNLGVSNKSQHSTCSLDDSFKKKGSSDQVTSSHLASSFSNSSSLRLLQFSVNLSSSSSFGSWGWGGGSNKMASSCLEGSNALGLVVVTAGLGGNIRIYQNFGFPVRLSRQNHLF